MAEGIQGLALVLALVAAYFIPAIIANSRRHKYTAGIVILNLFLGWTFVGWVVALIWAVSGEPLSKASKDKPGLSYPPFTEEERAARDITRTGEQEPRP